MGRGRIVIGTFVVALVLVAACGGQSQAPPAASQELTCLATLASDCCAGNGDTCIQTFADAELCGNWQSGATVLTYSSPCDAMQVVSVKKPGDSYTQYFLYSTAAGQNLYAIADNANVNGQGASEIECGAGPTTGFTVPSSCSTVWLDTAQGSPCTPGQTLTSDPYVPCN